MTVHRDRHGTITLELRRDQKLVVHISDPADGELQVVHTPVNEFDGRFCVHMTDYPVNRMARLLVGYAEHVGATDEVVTELGKLVTVTKKEVAMMTAKRVKAKKKTPPPPPKPGKHRYKNKSGKGLTVTGDTAASYYRQLIMQGKLTDDQIFAKVRKKFGVKDEYRTQVAWYRAQLKRHGHKPPPAKRPKR